MKQNTSPGEQSEAPRRRRKPGQEQNPAPENQDSQHMLERPRGHFPEKCIIKSPIFTHNPCKPTSIYNAPSLRTVEKITIEKQGFSPPALCQMSCEALASGGRRPSMLHVPQNKSISRIFTHQPGTERIEDVRAVVLRPFNPPRGVLGPSFGPKVGTELKMSSRGLLAPGSRMLKSESKRVKS